MARRSKIDIIWDMLIAIQLSGGEIKPTKLLYKSNLSHNKMKEYLAELHQNDIVDINVDEDNRKKIIITEKGHKYVAELKKVRDFGKTFGLRN